MKPQYNISEQLLNKIISTAYSDAGLLDKTIVYFAAIRNSEIRKLLHEYKTTARSIKNNNLIEKCPEYITNKVKEELHLKETKINLILQPFWSFILSRPVISGAATAIIILAVTAVLTIREPQVNKGYSKAEIELAERQVKESIVLVNRAFNKTNNILRNDIFNNQVAVPMKKGLRVISYLLNGG